MYLPLANILHRKLRSVLSALGIGIGVCMLVTLTGLSRGSLYEIAERTESIDADLIVVPAGAKSRTPTMAGLALSEKLSAVLEKRYPARVAKAVPVFIDSLRLAGQDHRFTGIRPGDWDVVAGGRELQQGQLCDKEGRFAAWLDAKKLEPATEDENGDAIAASLSAAELSDPAHNGLEIVIDSRLAAAGDFSVGQVVNAANHDWTIVGIVPRGVSTRIYMPLRTAQELFGVGDTTKCTMIFVKLKALPAGETVSQVAQRMSEELGLDVLPLSQFRGMLEQKFGIMFVFVDAVIAIALVIAFLFIMNTLYTMVLQRTREIAILKSCGASGAFILRQVLAESLLLTSIGVAMGLAMSFGAAWAIQTFRPLLTVEISGSWILISLAVAFGGAIVAAIYPAWRAMRVDMVEALSYE